VPLSPRQIAILERLRRAGTVRISVLVKELGVSDMTIRRDLDGLIAAGHAEKVHGGATLFGGGAALEMDFDDKLHRMMNEKRAIAESAAAMVRPGMALAIGAGSTTYALAGRLGDITGLTIVTNSVSIDEVLHRSTRGGHRVILTGGEHSTTDALVGPTAEAALVGLNADLTFLSATGMTAARGFTSATPSQASVNRTLMRCSETTIVLADHSKWGRAGFASFAALSAVDMVVSDSELGPEAQADIRERTTLVLA
jgi:DeoR/GlpR family transcriptional regulator of sugar metabolism